MPKQVAYVLDFDHTLFDTDAFFHVEGRKIVCELGIDGELWLKSYENVWPTGYTLEKHLEVLSQLCGQQCPAQEVKDRFHTAFGNLSRFLFPDTVPFLEQAKQKSIALYLLSFGAKKWQMFKVRNSGIFAYFDAILLTEREQAKADRILMLQNRHSRLIMVDNNARELDDIRERAGDIKTYWINRVPDVCRRPDSDDDPSRKMFWEAKKYLAYQPKYEHIPCVTLKALCHIG